MPEKEKETQDGQISRRQFIRNAGIVVGGTAVGSSILLSACGDGGETITKTATVTKTVNVTTSTAKYVCPYDSQEFDTFAALQAHVTANHQAGDPVAKYVCPYDNQEFDSLAALKAHIENEHIQVEAVDPTVISLDINGTAYTAKVQPYWSLAFVLRERLGFVGLKNGCDQGHCGSCTVIVDGKAVYSCMMLAMEADGMHIDTIEGLSDGITLHPIQQAFYDNDGFQCGYCAPGMIMATKALLDEKPQPTRDEIREALSGNWCCCGNTKRIVEAVMAVK